MLAQAFAPFIDPLALGIVGGGSVAAAILRTPLIDLGRAIRALPTLARPLFKVAPLLGQIEAFSRIAKRHGVMMLDRSIISDPDLSGAIALIVDGAMPSEVEALLDARRAARIVRHASAADVWAAIAEAAPAMGMVGTLIGLVRSFAAVSDPAAIGRAMAVALLATLYGALVANLIAAPIAARLRRAAREEALGRARMVAPLVRLAERERPRGPNLVSVA